MMKYRQRCAGCKATLIGFTMLPCIKYNKRIKWTAYSVDQFVCENKMKISGCRQRKVGTKKNNLKRMAWMVAYSSHLRFMSVQKKRRRYNAEEKREQIDDMSEKRHRQWQYVYCRARIPWRMHAQMYHFVMPFVSWMIPTCYSSPSPCPSPVKIVSTFIKTYASSVPDKVPLPLPKRQHTTNRRNFLFAYSPIHAPVPYRAVAVLVPFHNETFMCVIVNRFFSHSFLSCLAASSVQMARTKARHITTPSSLSFFFSFSFPPSPYHPNPSLLALPSDNEKNEEK